MKKYDHKTVEQKWKDKWYNDNIYEAVDFSPKPKKYILAELPYPSGPHLHVGHMMRYTVPDVYSRYLRMKGFNVMYPMGWDAFGLPTEGYAIKMNKTPQEVTKELAEGYKKSAQDMGYGIDWNREITTSDPEYYKWTQWLFLKFYEKGLAVQEEMPVWWCKELGVLADEEVLTDKEGNKISERGSYAVERKMFKQWVLKIPEYAEQLINGLEDTDFPDYIKIAQKNWIGKSTGAEITFKTEGNLSITVYTTRVDTIFGASAIIISPEYPNIEGFVTPDQKTVVTKYLHDAQQKSEMERITEQKDKTGVFTGSYAINPFSGEKCPIWVADFVLVTYATGAIMCVPAHDERDWEFAKKFGLPIKQVISPSDNSSWNVNEKAFTIEGLLVNSGSYSGMETAVAKNKMTGDAESKGFGKAKINYKMRNWVFSRQRYWGEPMPFVYKQNGEIEAIVNTQNAKEVQEKLPLELPYTKDYKPGEDGGAPLARLTDWVNTTDSNGNPAKRETETMPTWAGSNWYFIRYCDPHNDKEFANFDILKYWMPVDKYFGDGGHTTMHLLYSRFWYKFFYDLGLVPTTEPYMWRMTGGLLLGEDGQKMSKSRGNVLNPRDMIQEVGADALRMFLCFLGPYEETYPWNNNGLKATAKFIENLYSIKEKVSTAPVAGKDLEKPYNTMVKKVTGMCEDLKMNTCVSEFMIFANICKKSSTISTEQWKGYIKLLAPFIPFAAEDLWQEINGFTEWKKENSIHLQDWPTFNEALLVEDVALLPVQINGKTRLQLEIPTNATQEDVEEMVRENELVRVALEKTGLSQIEKVFYVKARIINVVAKQ